MEHNGGVDERALELIVLGCLTNRVLESLPYSILPPAAGCRPVWSDWDSVQDGGLFVSAQLLRPIVCSLFNYRVFLNEVVLEFSWCCWETAVLKKQTAGRRWADGSDTNTYSEHSVPIFSQCILVLNYVV